MEDLQNLVLAVILVFGLYFGAKLFIWWRAKKFVGRRFEGILDGLVYFYSPKCSACKKMEPVIEKLSKEINVFRVDITTEEGEKLAKEFGIFGTPTIFVVKGGSIKKVIIGTRSYEELKREISP